jgi:hypothetical protein
MKRPWKGLEMEASVKAIWIVISIVVSIVIWRVING